MKAWRVHRYGAPSGALQLDDVDVPAPGPREVLVRVAATVLNFNEIDGCRGRYLTVNPPVPYTLGMEAVGVVEAVGEGAERWAGRRVVATATGAFGAHAELMVAPVDMVFDGVGGEVAQSSLRCLARNGRLMMIGFASGIQAEDEPAFLPEPSASGTSRWEGCCSPTAATRSPPAGAGAFNITPRAVGEHVHEQLVGLLAAKAVHPIVGRVVPFTELPDALDAMERRDTVGRTVVVWDSGTPL